MAGILALGRTLGIEVSGIICSYLDDSSMAATIDTDAGDIGDLNDFLEEDDIIAEMYPLHWLRYNKAKQYQLYEGSLAYPDRM